MRVDLIEAARRGDFEAFEALVEGAADRLYGIARLILRNTDGAEDAVQEALVHAWQRLPELRDPERFDAWLYRLLVNACADHRRRRRRWAHELRTLGPEPRTPDATNAIADRDQLERGFRRLSLDQRAVVVLHYYSGLSLVEVAATLGIPRETAKSRLRYATEALRAALEADARPSSVARNGTTA